MSNIPSPTTTMEASVERIIGHPLSDTDRQMLIQLRDEYGYDDSDPLVVVLAMMGAYIILTNEIPDKIKKASEQIIETHAVVLRDASMIVAKDLVSTIAGQIHSAVQTRKVRLMYGAVGGLLGAIVMVLLFFFFKRYIG